VARDFEKLATKAMGILEENGVMLLASNYSKWNGENLEKIVSGKGFKIIKKGNGGKDSYMNFIIIFKPPL
jgi:23S rRNA G2069 N7-methylase RlmK/C1962 C5-methylase RlmI